MESFKHLYASSWIGIGAYSCRRPAGGPDPEEQTTAHQLALPLSGAFVKHSSAGRVLADPATAVVFSRGESYQVSHPDHGGDVCLVLSPASEALLELMLWHRPERLDRPEQPFDGAAWPVSAAAAQQLRLLRTALCDPSAGEAVEQRAGELLVALLAGSRPSRRAPPAKRSTREAQRALVDAARGQLLRSLARPATLSAVAAALGCTPFHLARAFRRETGHSVHGYATRLRLGVALDRLAEGDAGLARIAAELGFADHAHFTRRFRASFGVTPSGFRKRVAEIGARARRELSGEPGGGSAPAHGGEREDAPPQPALADRLLLGATAGAAPRSDPRVRRAGRAAARRRRSPPPTAPRR